MHAQRVGGGGRRQLPHLVVVGMKRQRDERLEAARLVLQRPRAQHVIDALFVRLDVAVQHRHVRAHAEAMRRAVNAQIPIRIGLVVTDLPAHALREDLGAAAGQRVEARVHQLAQDLLVGHRVEIREERDLDGGEALQVDLGTDPLEAAQQLLVVVERQIRMQAVDDVDFGEGLVGARAQLRPGLLRATCVYDPGSPGRSRENEQNRHVATQTFVASMRML